MGIVGQLNTVEDRAGPLLTFRTRVLRRSGTFLTIPICSIYTDAVFLVLRLVLFLFWKYTLVLKFNVLNEYVGITMSTYFAWLWKKCILIPWKSLKTTGTSNVSTLSFICQTFLTSFWTFLLILINEQNHLPCRATKKELQLARGVFSLAPGNQASVKLHHW